MPRGIPAQVAGTHLTRYGRLRPAIRRAIRELLARQVTEGTGYLARGMRIEVCTDDGLNLDTLTRLDDFKPREDFARLHLFVRGSVQRGMFRRTTSMELVTEGRLTLDGEQVSFEPNER